MATHTQVLVAGVHRVIGVAVAICLDRQSATEVIGLSRRTSTSAAGTGGTSCFDQARAARITAIAFVLSLSKDRGWVSEGFAKLSPNGRDVVVAPVVMGVAAVSIDLLDPNPGRNRRVGRPVAT